MSESESRPLETLPMTKPSGARHRFIPFRRRAILQLLCQDGRLKGRELERFCELFRIIEAYYHFLFHARLEELKDAYFPFNPDRDVFTIEEVTETELHDRGERLKAALLDVLRDANFEEIDQGEIEAALADESIFSLKLEIDFEDFEHCLVFARGHVIKTRDVPVWKFWKRTEDVPTWERVVLFIRFRGWDHFEKDGERPTLNFEPGSTIIKLFKDMPAAALEILFPNTQLRMRRTDLLFLGIPAVGGAIPILITKVLPHLPLLFSALFGVLAGKDLRQGQIIQAAIQGVIALGVLGGYCWRQWEKFRHRRIQYLQTLTQNLYFKNLDNNVGVFHHLIDAAEEEEVKEALLAYYFLLLEGPRTAADLDKRIEDWFEETRGQHLDFEVDHGLEKLETMGIGRREGEGETAVWSVMPVEEALTRVDDIWDGLFDYPGDLPPACRDACEARTREDDAAPKTADADKDDSADKAEAPA